MRVLSLLFAFCLLSFPVYAGEVKSDLLNSITSSDEELRVIIHFNDRPVQADIDDIKSKGRPAHSFKYLNAVAAHVTAKDIFELSKKSSVRLIEPDYRMSLVLDATSRQIGADKVWGYGTTGKNVDVAVIDTGIKNGHPVLHVSKETDFTGEGTDDLHGHGTHVAGIVASRDSRYRGISYDSNLFDVKVLNQFGSGYGSDVIKGIEWSVDNGAEIISMSLGARISNCDGTDAISQAVDKAVSSGVVVVVAAGNAGPDSGTITTPGCSKNGIAVGAVDDNDNVPSFSSRGPTADGRMKPDVVAPGVSVASTWIDGGFRSLSGTSMSTPHVAGVAALLLEANSQLTPNDIKNAIKSTSSDLKLDQNTQGSGRVDAYSAYLAASNGTDENNQTNETKKTPPGFSKRKGGARSEAFLYGLQRAMERIDLAFTFGEAAKTEKISKYEERRASVPEDVDESDDNSIEESISESSRPEDITGPVEESVISDNADTNTPSGNSDERDAGQNDNANNSHVPDAASNNSVPSERNGNNDSAEEKKSDKASEKSDNKASDKPNQNSQPDSSRAPSQSNAGGRGTGRFIEFLVNLF